MKPYRLVSLSIVATCLTVSSLSFAKAPETSKQLAGVYELIKESRGSNTSPCPETIEVTVDTRRVWLSDIRDQDEIGRSVRRPYGSLFEAKDSGCEFDSSAIVGDIDTFPRQNCTKFKKLSVSKSTVVRSIWGRFSEVTKVRLKNKATQLVYSYRERSIPWGIAVGNSDEFTCTYQRQ